MWLIGMMGTGKTSVGRLVASEVGVPFYDIDLLVEDMAGTAIATLWTTQGEEVFRSLEAEVVSRVPDDGVIAGGGGVVLDPRNRLHISASGPVFWLRASPETILERTGEDSARPLLAERDPLETIRELAWSRDDLYAEVADHEIDTDDRSVADVAAEVIALWRH